MRSVLVQSCTGIPEGVSLLCLHSPKCFHLKSKQAFSRAAFFIGFLCVPDSSYPVSVAYQQRDIPTGWQHFLKIPLRRGRLW